MQIVSRTVPFALAARRTAGHRRRGRGAAGGLLDVGGGEVGAGGTGCGGHAGGTEARVGGGFTEERRRLGAT